MRFSKFGRISCVMLFLLPTASTKASTFRSVNIIYESFQGSAHQREATEEELADVERMLRCRGVMPVSDSVVRAGSSKREKGVGLWTIVTSFRADKRTTGSTKTKS